MCIRRCCVGALLSVISPLFYFFVKAFETPRAYAMFGCKFTPGVENATTHSQKTRFLQLYGFKSAADQMMPTIIQLECAVCILVTF